MEFIEASIFLCAMDNQEEGAKLMIRGMLSRERQELQKAVSRLELWLDEADAEPDVDKQRRNYESI